MSEGKQSVLFINKTCFKYLQYPNIIQTELANWVIMPTKMMTLIIIIPTKDDDY